MPAGLHPRWISAATKLFGPLTRNQSPASGPGWFRRGRHHFVDATLVAAGASSRMKIETLTVDFTDEQKRYLEGFTTGLQISRVGRGLGGGTKANAEPTG